MLKVLSFTALFILALTAYSFGQETASATEESETIEWKAMTHDFGSITQGVPVSFDFAFENVSNDPIYIDNVRVTCGCTAPDWAREPILPSETSFIEIEFNAKKEGVFSKDIKVYVKGVKEPVLLTIKGTVTPKKGEG